MSGGGKVETCVGGVCSVNSCFFLSCALGGEAEVTCSVRRVEMGLASGGRAGTAGSRAVRLAPMFSVGGAHGFEGSCEGMLMLPGLAFPRRGILHLRVSRGRVDKHMIMLAVRCRSVLGTSNFSSSVLSNTSCCPCCCVSRSVGE